jgi:hypothetical protein
MRLLAVFDLRGLRHTHMGERSVVECTWSYITRANRCSHNDSQRHMYMHPGFGKKSESICTACRYRRADATITPPTHAHYARRNPTFLRLKVSHAAQQQPCERGWNMHQYQTIVTLAGAGRCRAVFDRPGIRYRAFRHAASSDKLSAITPLSVMLSPPPLKSIRPVARHGMVFGCDFTCA